MWVCECVDLSSAAGELTRKEKDGQDRTHGQSEVPSGGKAASLRCGCFLLPSELLSCVNDQISRSTSDLGLTALDRSLLQSARTVRPKDRYRQKKADSRSTDESHPPPGLGHSSSDQNLKTGLHSVK